MRVLAIETACSACSAALWADGGIAASRFAPMERGQAEAIMPMVLEVVGEGCGGFAGLDLVAVTVGPGSFTGLRTGLATARGIALARGLPLAGVTTTEAVALAAHRAAPPEAAGLPIVVALESRRTDLYLQRFDAGLAPLAEPAAVTPHDAAALLPDGGALLAGDAVPRLVAALGARAKRCVVARAAMLPDAAQVAEIASRRWSGRDGDAAEDAVAPLYLRPPEAHRPVAGGRLRP